MLTAMAAELEARREELVAVADRETGLGSPRLPGELTRTVFQLQFFAEVLREGSYLEATIDHRGETPAGVRPDLRRIMRPRGAVGRVRRQQLPVRLLRARRGHGVRARRRLPGGGQGARGAPGHLAALLRGARCRCGGCRRPGAHRLAGRRLGRGTRARRAPAGPGRRIHRVAERRTRARRHRRGPAGADPVLR